MTRHLTLRVYRYKAGAAPHYDTFQVEVPDSANVLDALERAWDDHDRTLNFRHACHHASCGSCGLRVNGREKLPCVTPVTDYPEGATLTLDPMRNFEVISDLAVDASPLYTKMTAVQAPIDRLAESVKPGEAETLPPGVQEFMRFENCIECGLCLSACPSMAADPYYLGPAAIAGAERALIEDARGVRAADRPALLALLDSDDGLWRCHSAWECTAVCPSNVFPAEAIMRLRRLVEAQKIKKLFGRGE